MMDRIVPGGVAADLAPDGRRRCAHCSARSARAFPQLVELYDNTASLQDRTVTTGIVTPELARQFGAGGYVGRASGRAFDARRHRRLCALRRACTSTCRCSTAGDVDARVWIRIREVEQSLSLLEQMLDRPAGRARSRIDAAAAGESARGHGAGRRLPRRRAGLAAARRQTDGSRAATCAIRPGSSGRCSKRRSRATSSPTSRSATNPSTAPIPGTISEAHMRKLLFESLIRVAADRAAAAPDDAALAELAHSARRGAARGGSAAACRSARSMPAPATAASSKSTRSTTPSTISSASACASSPRRAMPTC